MKGPYLKKWSQSDDPSLYVHDGLYHIAVSLILTKASTGRPKFFLILLGNTSRIPNLLSERPACQNRPCQVLCTPKRTHLWACRLHCGWTPDRQALIFFGDERYILYLPKTGLRTACLGGFLTWWPMQWLDRPQTAQMRHGTCGSACICLKMGMCDLAMCKKVLEKFHAHRDRCWPVREERAPEIVGGSASWETPASLNLNCTRFPFGKRKRSPKKPNRTEDVGYLTPPSTAKYR
jgi:hypothetical protein